MIKIYIYNKIEGDDYNIILQKGEKDFEELDIDILNDTGTTVTYTVESRQNVSDINSMFIADYDNKYTSIVLRNM